MIEIQQIDHVAIPVADADRSREWYQRLFGLEEVYREHWHGDPVFLRAGETYLALLPAPVTLYEGHFAFRVDRAAFDLARAALDREGVPYTIDDHQVSIGLYMRDPDGHTVELACYEREGPTGTPA